MTGVRQVLVTGGTGKTGRAVANGLRSRGVPCRIAARTAGPDIVRFDWMNESTYAPALVDVDSIYLVAPAGVLDPVPVMTQFIDRALETGIRRFCLLSSSAIPIDGPAMGQIHRLLAEKAPEWAVLRPSWFMQNFTEGHHGDTIRKERSVFSATGNAAVAFIDAEDIGDAAAATFNLEEPLNGEVILTGPSSHSYDKVAEIISRHSGLDITHLLLDPPMLSRRFSEFGLDEDYSDFLAQLDAFLAGGSEARTTDAVRELTGREPRSFEEFARLNHRAWQ